MLKKMMLLAMAVGALIAFAAPAAQANGPVFNNATEEFEGFLKFDVPGAPVPGSSFGCDVTIAIQGNGNDTATVETFEPTTESCGGTGLFVGCELVGDESNAPFDAVSNTDHDIVVTDDEASITIRNFYAGCAFGLPGSHLEFESVLATPSPTEGAISTIDIEATSSSSPTAIASGTLHAETDEELTLTT